MKQSRLISILMYMLNKDRVTAKELAGRYEVSIRTIHRDMEELAIAGIPIAAMKGAGGGYEIMETYKVEKSFLTEKEVDVLYNMLLGFSGSALDEEARELLSKIEAMYKAGKQERSIIMDFTGWSDPIYVKHMVELFRRAMNNTTILSIIYVNNNGETTVRRVHPYKLLFKNNVWYVYAYCERAKDFRIFKLIRIKDVEILDEKFSKREMPAVESEFMSERDADEEIRLLFDEGAYSRLLDFFGREQLNFMEDGGIEVRASFPIDEWVIHMILGYGDQVRVLHPEHLRETIIRRIKKMQEVYEI